MATKSNDFHIFDAGKYNIVKYMANEIEQNKGEIIIYQSDDGKVRLDVRLENKTVWLTQDQIAMLFSKGRSTITEHINNIFKEGELEKEKVCRKFRHTTPHGAIEGKSRSTINEHILNAYAEGEIEEAKTIRKIGISDFSTKPTNYYNLDVIIENFK